MKAVEETLNEKQEQKPTFELSGKLAAETNRVRGVTLLFSEPPDARKPNIRWRLYVFKAGEVLNEPLYLHHQSCYLFRRERPVADIPTDHPSCSKQHAVIQFQQVEKEQPDGTLSREVRSYIMDLGSTNKTFISDNAIEHLVIVAESMFYSMRILPCDGYLQAPQSCGSISSERFRIGKYFCYQHVCYKGNSLFSNAVVLQLYFLHVTQMT